MTGGATGKRTVQLSVRDAPTSFDYSAQNNLLAVSSSSDIAFYRLEDLGSPNQVIHFEQQSKCSSIRFQQGGPGLVSCINDGVVSIWDPSKSVQPMIDFIHASKGIQDLQWSPHSFETLATSSAAGNLTTWDVRAAMRPTHDLMVHKFCSKIEWCPHNPHLIAASCEDRYLLVWDIRMMPPMQNSLASSSNDMEEAPFHVIESEEGILDFTWSPVSTALYATTENCGLDLWSLTPCEENGFDSSRASTSRSSLINDHTKLLPGPYGERLALLYRRPRTGESSVYLRKYQDTSPVKSLNSTESTYAPSVESPCHEPSDKAQADAFQKIGTSRSRILDMKWIQTPRASLPDSRDLDLLLLNEDGLLQILHIPSFSGSRSSRSTETSQAYFSKRSTPVPNFHLGWSGSDLAGLDGRGQRYNLRQASQVSMTGSSTGDRLDGLNLDRDKPASQGSSAANLLRERDSTPTAVSKRYSLGARSVSSAALANPQLMMVGPVTFQSLLEDDLIALEYGINHGYLEGWRIGRIDQFSRRIYLELLIPNIDSYTITNKQNNASFTTYYRSEDVNSFYSQKRAGNVRFVELMISFPVKYINFWSPTFAIENKSGLAFNPVSLSGLIIELTAICKTFSEKMASRSSTDIAGMAKASVPHMGDCLLFQLTRCFRKRLFKMWEKIIESDRITISFTTLQQGNNESNVASTSLKSEHDMEVDEQAPYMKYIEALAFRVPAPVSSAGIFNAQGKLVCFGNAKISLTAESCPSSGTRPTSTATSSSSKHKSYANTLVSKIISTTTELETGAINASTSAEIDGTTTGPGVDLNAAGSNGPARGGGAPEGETSHRSPVPSSVPAALKLPRTSSASEGSEDEEEEGEEGSARNRMLSEDDEEYQFTFDQETKAATPAPALKTRPAHSSGGEIKPLPAPLALNLNTQDLGKRDSAPVSMSNWSQPSFALPEEEAEPEKKSTHKYTLYIYSVMYRQERRLLHAYSVGPLSRRLDDLPGQTPITPVAQAVAAQMTVTAARGKAKGRQGASAANPPVPRTTAPVAALTQEEAYERAAACRQNAASVQELSPEDKGLSQFWNLLAVVLDMLTITDSGCLIGWNHCTIGLALLHRLYKYLCEVADVQTFATALCILGGSDILIDLLVPYYAKSRPEATAPEEKKSAAQAQFDAPRTKKYLESVMYCYNDVLHRWGEQLSAAEVSKHLNYDHFAPLPRMNVPDAKGFEMSVKVCCYYCEKEIESNASGLTSNSSLSPNASSSNLSGGRSGSGGGRSGNQVTFFPGTTGGLSGPPAASGTLLWCSDCKDWAQRCVVCELAVRGAVSVCAKCGHGGHFTHMQSWFARSKVCPSGCGCRCTAEGTEKATDNLSDSEKEEEEFVEDGENVRDRDIYDMFGTNPPNYLEEIYNQASDYNYNNFFEKWADSPAGEVYYEYS